MDSRYVVEINELACTVDRREPKKRDRAREVLRRMGGFAVPLVRDDLDAALRERLLPYTLSKYQLVSIYNTPYEANTQSSDGGRNERAKAKPSTKPGGKANKKESSPSPSIIQF